MLDRIVEGLGRQIRSGHGGLLRRERYSSDVAARVYGLHAQAAVWQGLNAIADVWRSSGRTAHARKAHALAVALGRGLHRAVGRSAHRLKDGSLFVPAALLAHHKPFDAVTSSRPGSYWNLVVPYALSSGFFTPGSRAGERDRSSTCSGTARGCSGWCAPARTRCTASRSTRSRAPTRSTD